MEKQLEIHEVLNAVHTLTGTLTAQVHGNSILNEDENKKVREKLIEYVNKL